MKSRDVPRMMCLSKIRIIILLLLIGCASCTSTRLTEVTHTLFTGVEDGIIAAFGDFNVDRLTDIFVITNGGQQVELLVSKKNENGYTRGPKPLVPKKKGDKSIITSVVPGDFDGDVQMDVLLTRKLGAYLSVEIYWGNSTAISVSEEPYKFNETTFQDEPTLLDWNADMLPDLLIETSAGNRSIWLASTSRTFQRIPFPGNVSQSPFLKPHSNAFVDLNSDCTADLLITTINGFEVWLNKDGTLQYDHTIPLPFIHGNTGQITAVDMDQDTFMDLLLPVNRTEIYVYTHKDTQWQLMAKDFSHDKKSWVFAEPAKLNVSLPLTLRVGDFDMDGYPDVLTVLQYIHANGTREDKAVLLLNVECGEDEKSCEETGRKLEAQWTTGLDTTGHVAAATFFDLYENGILDVILVTESSAKPSVPKTRAFKNQLSDDAYFVKVTVGSGRKPASKPYSVNQAGATIKYTATRTDRSTQESSATQLSQSAHFALQMPYTVFGLGQTPNFVDTLSVGIPKPQSSKTPRVREWTQIIPNSQMVVVPYPNDNPSNWVLKLSLTPSHMVIVTAAVLVGTCGCVAVIVAILQWREKRDDKEEKRLDAHKFHFDAM